MSRTLALGFSVVMILAVTASARAPQGTGGASRKVTKEQFEQWKKDLNNWGRWGKDDEIGTLNFITPAKRKQAAGLVREGFSVSLASDADTEKAIDNPQPYEHEMLALGSDRIGVAFHGIAHTHLDSLAHINYDGVYVEDIEAWLKKTGLKILPGDAVFVRAGVWARRKEVGPYQRGRGGKDAGLDPSVIPWLKKQDIAILAADHPQYVSPSDLTGAIHDFALVSLGIHLIDNCDLEALSEAAAARKRWEFLLTAAPLPIKGGTGSPLNPIATF